MVSSGMVEANLPLQPWRYLRETVCQLAAQGHRVTLITDGDKVLLPGIDIRHLRSVSNPRVCPNRRLFAVIARARPDVILWHLGLTSLLHQRSDGGGATPVVGIFTSPLYYWEELTRLGWPKLLRGHRLSLVHLLGTMVPRSLLRRRLAQSGMRALAVQTRTTAHRLAEMELWHNPIAVIPPGVDDAWVRGPVDVPNGLRESLNYRPQDVVVVYFGSPAELRGLPTLIRAVALARRDAPALRLLILNRQREGEFGSEQGGLQRLLMECEISSYVQIVDNYLDRAALVDHVALADLVALPFELLPSDAPLSLLEARALGKPVITTKLACLPELVSRDVGYLAEPADPHSLAHALVCAAGERNKERGRPENKSGCLSRSWRQVGAEWSQLIQNL
jgi:glycosyltransferase involved in cell wall biosynthesis